MTWFRLVVKWHRSELLAIAFLGSCLLIGCAVAAWSANNLVIGSPKCFDGRSASGCSDAHASLRALQSTSAAVFAAASVGSFLVGLILGAPIVSREIETGSAQLVFSLAGSRRRWLMDRLTPVMVIAFVVGIIGAIATDGLGNLLMRTNGPEGAFSWYGGRGSLLIAHTIVGTAAGAIAGLISGRILPAVLIGAAVCGSLAAGIDLLRHAWLASIAEPIGPASEAGGGLLIMSSSGANLLVSNARYDEGVARDLALYAVASLALIALGLVIVRHRSPR